jgi:hypothetical protein
MFRFDGYLQRQAWLSGCVGQPASAQPQQARGSAPVLATAADQGEIIDIPVRT